MRIDMRVQTDASNAIYDKSEPCQDSNIRHDTDTTASTFLNNPNNPKNNPIQDASFSRGG